VNNSHLTARKIQIVWDTTKFNNKADWPADGSQPFHLSTGDNTGYGQHADYVFGWKDDALQKAMDDRGCFSAVCGGLKTQDISVANKCVIPKTVKEDVDGCKSHAPFPPLSLIYSGILTHALGLQKLPGVGM
jgi:hypothetical protein